MKTPEEQMYWRGVLLEDMTKEDLIVALKQMHSMYRGVGDDLKDMAALARRISGRKAA